MIIGQKESLGKTLVRAFNKLEQLSPGLPKMFARDG